MHLLKDVLNEVRVKMQVCGETIKVLGCCTVGLRGLPMCEQLEWSRVCLCNRNLNLGSSVFKMGVTCLAVLILK